VKEDNSEIAIMEQQIVEMEESMGRLQEEQGLIDQVVNPKLT